MRRGISVIVPVYNGALYLSECIASVGAQTLAADDIIVIDDGSEDDTQQVAAEWAGRIRYHRVPHGGLPYARNHGLRLVETDVIAFIDSDDVWLPDKLEKQMDVLARQNRPAMVFGHVQQFVSSDLAPDEASQIQVSNSPVPGLFGSTLLMWTRDCETVGPFDESIQTGEFIEWCSRASDSGLKTVMLPEIVCRRRLHRSNMGRGGASTHIGYVHMLKKVLDRRKGQG